MATRSNTTPKASGDPKRLPGLAPWIGGKRNLAARIAERIAAIPHHCYAEPFAGMGGVFLARRNRARAEAINDRNGDIVNLFRVVQRHPNALRDTLRYGLVARQQFERLIDLDPDSLTDIERAARYFTIMRQCFGGKPDNRSRPGR